MWRSHSATTSSHCHALYSLCAAESVAQAGCRAQRTKLAGEKGVPVLRQKISLSASEPARQLGQHPQKSQRRNTTEREKSPKATPYPARTPGCSTRAPQKCLRILLRIHVSNGPCDLDSRLEGRVKSCNHQKRTICRNGSRGPSGLKRTAPPQRIQGGT